MIIKQNAGYKLRDSSAMRKYHHKKTCQQCGGILKGYYDFSTCSACYSKNVEENQKKVLDTLKQKP